MSEVALSSTKKTGRSIWRVAALLAVAGLVMALALQLRARNPHSPHPAPRPILR